MGWLFGLLFFLGLFGAAYLSAVAAFEVLVGGAVDNSRIERKKVGTFYQAFSSPFPSID